MSVKSIGYQNITLQAGTYTTAALTLSPSLQIVDIKSQVIEADGDVQTEYDTLVSNTEALVVSCDTIQANLRTLETDLSNIDVETTSNEYDTLLAEYTDLLNQFNSQVRRPIISIAQVISSASLPSSQGSGTAVIGPSFSLDAGVYVALINFSGTMTIADAGAEIVAISVGLRSGTGGDVPSRPLLGSCAQDSWFQRDGIFYYAMTGSFTFTLTATTTCQFSLAGNFNIQTININTTATVPNIGLASVNNTDYTVSGVQSNPPQLALNPRALMVTKLS